MVFTYSQWSLHWSLLTTRGKRITLFWGNLEDKWSQVKLTVRTHELTSMMYWEENTITHVVSLSKMKPESNHNETPDKLELSNTSQNNWFVLLKYVHVLKTKTDWVGWKRIQTRVE